MKKKAPLSKKKENQKDDLAVGDLSRPIKVSAATHRSMIIEKLPGYFLLVCVLATFYFLFQILSPFLAVIFVAAVLAITFYPLYLKILSWMPNWKKTASLLSCFTVILITFVPLTIFVIMISNQAADTYQVITENVESGAFDEYLLWDQGGKIYDLVDDFSRYVEDYVDIESINLKENIISWAQGLSTYLVSQISNVFASLVNLMMNLFIMFFSMFYFFKDGEKIVEKIGILSPLPSVYEEELFKKIGDMVKAIMVGVFLTAVLQGLVGGIGYAIVGISNAAFWATAIALFSLVPLLGTAVVWVPTVIILLVLGNYWEAGFLTIWSVIITGSVDNIVRPYLIGGKAHTYPLLTFFVILGGIFVMGFKGIIVGPLVLMALISFLHIYEAEYQKVLKR